MRCRELFLVILFLFFPLVGIAEQPVDSIKAIRFIGNLRVDDELIAQTINSEAAGVYNQSELEEDIKRIYRMGFFDDVRVEAYREGEQAQVVFFLKEKPGIRDFLIEGNKELTDSDIRDELNPVGRKYLDKQKLDAGVKQVESLYESKGYYGTEVSYQIVEVENNQVDVKLEIEEGEKQVIQEIVFEGNKAFPDEDLYSEISTRTYSWWISWLTGRGVLKEEQLDIDLQLLNRYYLNNGYVDVKVTEPLIQKVDEGLKLIYRVSEGEQYRFGQIKASGTLLEGGEVETLEGIKSKSGEVFDVSKLREDSFSISEKFTDIGYAFANVDPRTAIDRANQIVELDFFVDKGRLIKVNRIEIVGNQKTKDNVIRRSVNISEQELFSSSKIKRSQQLLQRLGFFEEVSITPDKTNNEDFVDLNVSVREARTGTFSAGAGVSSDDGFIVNARVTENNFMGTGNSLTLNLDTGSSRENYVLSYANPRYNDSRLSLGFDVLSVERAFDDFDRNQTGASFTIGYPLWFLDEEDIDDYNFSVTYEFLSVEIDEVEEDAPQLIKDEEGSTTSSSISPRIVRNTIDNPLFPTSGSRQTLKLELAGLGGKEEFWLVRATNTFYRELFTVADKPIIFSNRVNFGYGKTFNDEDFPLFRRFFPGGINSVRGFDARELGPKDAEGNEFGGNKQFVSNFELIFPLSDSLGLNGVVFYDIGNAFDDDENIKFGDLRQAIGWGIRWRSPIAPIRIEVGYPLDKETGDSSVVTNFSFGSPL